jgi:hypothetical protein
VKTFFPPRFTKQLDPYVEIVPHGCPKYLASNIFRKSFVCGSDSRIKLFV